LLRAEDEFVRCLKFFAVKHFYGQFYLQSTDKMRISSKKYADFEKDVLSWIFLLYCYKRKIEVVIR
jgi:hypothetical protein